MKIPGISVHILTEKALREERLKAEKAGRAFTKKQMDIILSDNVTLRQTIIGFRRKQKELNLN